MPRATTDASMTERHELKSCPEGFIVARRLSYGEKLERRAMMSGMKVETGGKGKDFAGEMQLMNEQATLYDFQKCIVEHNLEDENGNTLNLNSVTDIRRLDPRIGEEIETILGDLNNFEVDEGN